MRRLTIPMVKICCIKSNAEAAMAIRAGASALGFVSNMPSGPGVLPDQEIASLVAKLPPAVSSVLLTERCHSDDILAQHALCDTTALQFVDRVEPADLERVKERLPNVSLIQVIHVQGEESLQEAKEIAPWVDVILLDSGDPTLSIKELGGTGRTHDWNISRRICQELKTPILLAGGLCAQNLAEAITTVSPYGVDVCTGVRSEDLLDSDKLKSFFSSIWPGAAGVNL